MRDTARKKFNNLTLQEKSNLITSYGKTLWFTDYNEFRISVFELEGEIVEVWYHVYQRTIRQIRIPNYEQLDIHLHCVQLQDLY